MSSIIARKGSIPHHYGFPEANGLPNCGDAVSSMCIDLHDLVHALNSSLTSVVIPAASLLYLQ